MGRLTVYRAGRYVPDNAGIVLRDPQLLVTDWRRGAVPDRLDYFDLDRNAVLEELRPGTPLVDHLLLRGLAHVYVFGLDLGGAERLWRYGDTGRVEQLRYP